MDRETTRLIESYRRNEAGPLENNLIDEFIGGEMDRSEFLRRGTMFGLSVGMMGGVLAMAGEAVAAPRATARATSVKAGGTIRVGLTAPGGPIEPYLLNDGGALAFSSIPGEYLTFTNPKGQLVPSLATSWKPNKDATVWTFQIRKGVKFHDGKTMTAADVVASMKQYVGVKSSNAGLTPYFDAAGVKATGPYTVAVHAEVADRRLPVPAQPDHVPGHHPAGLRRGQARLVGQGGHDRHGPVQDDEVHREAGRSVRPPQRLLGRAATARRRQGDVLHGQRAARPRTARWLDRPRDAALGARGAGVQEQLEVHLLLAADVGAPAVLHAHRHGRR